MKYEIVSDRPCLIDAVGEMKPGEPVLLSQDDATLFKAVHGHQVAESNFPSYVSITALPNDAE